DLYRSTPGPLDPEESAAARTLADVTAAYLVNAQARADLQHASDSARATALQDPLTGLPNRTLLIQRLEHAIQRCRRSRKIAAVLFVDLDNFKVVNDAYGHHVGDEMLIAVALRLSSMLRPGDTLARMSGDEFVILCEDLDDPVQVEPIASRLDDAMARAFVVSGIEIIVTASVGISFAGPERDDSELVLQDADAAMYQIKHRGGGRHGVIDLKERQLADHRAKLNRDLRGALSRGEMAAEYQPIVSTSGGRITSVEALLRWVHPTEGLVEATTAVRLAEMSGLITGIGTWMLERACLDQKTWPVGGRRLLPISVNVSAHQLMAPEFVATVESVLAKVVTRPEWVILEVTESVFIQDSARALVVLRELKRLGVKLALDDFGTGYSSLGYLQRFPVDIVKVDRVFITDVDREPASGSIVRALVGLAHDLGMTVVAEGVETEEQYERVVSLGCDAYQGFLFSESMPSQELGQMMDARQSSPSHFRRLARPWQFLTGGSQRRAS
ncbi:MAG: EAL domain-containing protein, partial [Acidimicrobiales bacterium]